MSIAAAYRTREVASVNYGLGELAFGEYLPSGVIQIQDIDPRLIFPFVGGGTQVYPQSVTASQNSTEDDTLLITGSVQKKWGNHTDLRFDATYTERESSTFNSRTTFASQATYRLLPVDELGGEPRFALRAEDPYEPGSFQEQIFGNGFVGNVSRSADFRPSDESDVLNLAVRGTTNLDAWDFGYSAGYNQSTSSQSPSLTFELAPQAPNDGGFLTNNVLDASFFTDEVLRNTVDGGVVSFFAPLSRGDNDAFVLPLLSDDGVLFFNDIRNVSFLDGIRSTPVEGSGDALTLKGSARRNFSVEYFRYLEIGFDYQDASFESERGVGVRTSLNGVSEIVSFAPLIFENVPLSELGLEFGPGILESVGATGDFDALTADSVEAFYGTLDSLIERGLLEGTDNDFTKILPSDRGRNETGEETLSVYLQGRVDIGKLELIGGVRVEELTVSASFLESPRLTQGFNFIDLRDQGVFVTEEVSRTDVLPRLQANYRYSDNLIFRGSYYLTKSQPQLQNLTSVRGLDLNLQDPVTGFGQNRLQIIEGNPDLKPAETQNFSIGAEWFTRNVGVVKVTAFYKEIENPLQTNAVVGGIELLPEDLDLPDIEEFQNLPADIEVELSQPRNGEDDWTIFGVEAVFERQLSELPGWFGGLGIYSNITYTDSSSTREIRINQVDPNSEVIRFDDVPFGGAPEYSGTVGVTYRGGGFDGSVLYTLQDRRQDVFGRNGLSSYSEEFDTLDFLLSYSRELYGSNVRVYVRGNDLLRDKNESFLDTSVGGEFGAPIYITGSSFFGGRSFSVGVSATF